MSDKVSVPMDLTSIASLSKQQRLELEARLIGYQKMPPSIEQFIEDPYYMGSIYGNGKLFPFWIPILKKIYPTPIHTEYNNVVLTGCLGSGKSTVSRLMAAYMKCRLDHMENFDFFGLAKGKNLVMSYFHTTGELVDNTFTGPLRNLSDPSSENSVPYFIDGQLNGHKIVDMADSPRGKGPIGADVLFYVFSEINFIKPAIAKLKLDTAFNRMASRFKKITPYFGHIILDSSAKEGGSFVDEFVEKNSDPNTTLIVRAKIWEVKAHQGIYGNTVDKMFGSIESAGFYLNEGGRLFIGNRVIYERKDIPGDIEFPCKLRVSDGWFDVYLGDSTRDAFIMNYRGEIDPTLDMDRILKVPQELESEFKLNLELSLQDHAGISTTSNNVFIMNREAIPNTFTMPMRTKEVVEIDFYDRKDSIMNYVRDAVKFIPRNKVLSIAFDIGYKHDYTGIAISHFDDFEIIDKKNKTRVPKFSTPIAFALGRKQGQETSIKLLYEFVKDLSKDFEVGMISCDTFQSKQLMQDLERDGFETLVQSVDKTDVIYQYFKLAMYEKRLEICQSKLLMREVRELEYIDRKVDHPELTKSDNMTNGRGSKDVADATAESIYAMTYDLEKFTNISKHYNRETYLERMKLQTVTKKDNILKDMKKISKTGGMERFLKKEHERRSMMHGMENAKLATERSHKIYKSQYIRFDNDNDN